MKRNRKSLAIAWLDIANAYGSVHHSLIQFSLAHYHAPPEFCRLLASWYTGLPASISCDEWVTEPVPLNVGVYQGDPLSVVVFLSVMNTLSDTLVMRTDLGYTLPGTSLTTNHLFYADDACIISSSPAGCKYLLDTVQRWLDWALLRAKAPKCHCLTIQASSGKSTAHSGEEIQHIENDKFKFLGMPVRIYHNNREARSALKDRLSQMLRKIDSIPLTRQQKLRLFKDGVCPRLSWSLLTENLPTSWLEKELQPLATKALKKWAGLTRSSNISVLFLPAKRGGLGLPSLVGQYKKLQISRMVQLQPSSDPGVRKAAKIDLDQERVSLGRVFKPATLVAELRASNNSRSQRALAGAAKTLIAEEEADQWQTALCELPAQGDMARRWDEASPDIWVKAVKGLPPETLKFALNASLDTLPTNKNLHLWGKKSLAICPLCQEAKQSLLHVLNHCSKALELRRYSKRHNQVLLVFANFIRAALPSDFSVTIDHPTSTYNFPHHITPTDLRPDIVWWSDQKKKLYLFELTICFESSVAEA